MLVVVVAGVALFLAYGPDEQAVIRRSGEWRAEARAHLFAAVLIFFTAEVILVAFSVPVGIWLTVLAGFLFGTWAGTAVVSCASTLGAVLAFLAARYVFADALRRTASARPRLGRALAAIDRGFRAHGAYYVLLLRLTPVFPFWLLNLGLGLTPVRLRDYWWASQLGMLPVTLVVANAGASLAEITSFRDVLSFDVLGALGLMPLVPFVLHHTIGRWLVRRTAQETA
ncbi:MAG: pyridine nucleotide-disulfide oxidoreductase [Gemmataceae bacterium]|nr:pyridine nucleotide-disulfide oxidoreductase [Gemmataceae bacterium]